MSIHSSPGAEPIKDLRRYSAGQFHFHRTGHDNYARPPFEHGYVWLPPADFTDFLSGQPERLVIVREDHDFVVRDTRNGDIYNTEFDEQEVAARLFSVALARFKNEISKEFGVDLREASIKCRSDHFVMKWENTSVKFSSPSEWSLYDGYDLIETARTIRELLDNHPEIAIPRRNDGANVSESRELEGLTPRNRVTPQLLQMKKTDDVFASPQPFFEKFEKDRILDRRRTPLPCIYGYDWIHPRNWEEFLSDKAERTVVLQTKQGFEIHSPRSDSVIKGEDFRAGVDQFHREAHDRFRDSLQAKFGLDLSGAEVVAHADAVRIEWVELGLSAEYRLDMDAWWIVDEWYFDEGDLTRVIGERYPDLLINGPTATARTS
ncbi:MULTISPECIES: hypothetical protein [Agrobacterium]|uniref:hypothetical protein n=1 Tax=Agrobacterium tumefaciens TaxID=358 RepID=UPI0015718984|nr:hypothetical protein [Agrobacterium tumefaciens]NSZ06314.1 hypothetical protein [Agrobacterium tumefaciens]